MYATRYQTEFSILEFCCNKVFLSIKIDEEPEEEPEEEDKDIEEDDSNENDAIDDEADKDKDDDDEVFKQIPLLQHRLIAEQIFLDCLYTHFCFICPFNQWFTH